MSKEAMTLALEALEMCECGAYDKSAIKAVRQVIAEAEKQEPVAYMYPDDLKEFETREMSAHAYSLEMVSPTQGETVPLYTTPQRCSNCASLEDQNTELDAKLAEYEQGEPVAYLNPDDVCADTAFRWCKIDEFKQPVYTTPQPAQKPLTFERVYELWLARFETNEYDDVFMNFARAIEAAHGIKE